MTWILPRRGGRLLLPFALTFSLLAPARPALAASPSEIGTALIDSAKLVRAAVAQTGAAIAGRVRALSGNGVASPLALTPDRHVRVLALGNGGTLLPSSRDDEARAAAAKAGIAISEPPLKTPIGVWVDGAWSRLQFDDGGASFDGEMWSGLAGIDYALDDRLILGLASGYESQNFDITNFDGEISGDGLKVAPYAVYRLDDNLSLDASGGYAWLSYADTHRDPSSGQSRAGAAKASRWYMASDLNAAYRFDSWRLDSRFGALYADDGIDRLADTDPSGGQVMAVGDLRLGYRFDWLDGFEPYISALGHLAYEDGTDDGADSLLGIGASLWFRGARLDLQGTSADNADGPAAYAALINLNVGL